MSISKINNELDKVVEKFSNYSTTDTNETVEVPSGDSAYTETFHEVLENVLDPVSLFSIAVILLIPIVLRMGYDLFTGSFTGSSKTFHSTTSSSLGYSEEQFSPRVEKEFVPRVKKSLPDSHKVDKSIAESQKVIERYNLLRSRYTGLHTAPQRYEIMITTPALLDLNVIPTKKMDEAIISLMKYADSALPHLVTEPSMLVTDTDVDDNNALITEISSRIDKAEALWIQAEQHAAVVGIPNTSSTHYELGKKLINQLTGPGFTDNERVSAWNRLKDLAIKMGVSENVVSGTQEYTQELIPATRIAIES